MPRTRIKICGIRDEEAALAAAKAGADAIGFVFARGSVRSIQPERAFEIQAVLPPFLSTVGVFVDASVDAFCDIEETCPTTFAQLHGNEDEPTVRACGPGVIKAVRFESATIAGDLARWDAIDEVDAILIDGSAGGEGTAFDWESLAPHLADLAKPVILAGGLTPENVGKAIRAVRPYAVDVSSGVERERGAKDPALIDAFCESVRRADAG